MPRSERTQAQLLWVALALALIATSWGMLSISKSLANRFNLALYVITNALVFVDSLDLLCRTAVMSFGDRRLDHPSSQSYSQQRSDGSAPLTLFQKRLHIKPWAIAVSVHNAESALFEFLESVDYLRERIWIIDDGSSDGTCEYLRNIGWRCFRSDVNLKKPGAIYSLVQNLPLDIETILVIDPDIEIASKNGLGLAALEEVIFDFQQSGLAAICPRLAIKPEGFLSKFQMLEYCLAFYGRRSLGSSSITSGIALYRKRSFSTILALHSKSVYAEDLENSILLLGMGAKVGSEARLVIHTEAKTTLRAWYSQRIGWSYGLIKVYFERFNDIRNIGMRSKMNFYHYICYMGLFSLLAQPLKTASLAAIVLSLLQGVLHLLGFTSETMFTLFEPIYFLSTFGKYFVLMLITWLVVVPRNERSQVAPILPVYLLYSLFQTSATTIGYLNWITLRVLGRRLIRDHYDDREELRFTRMTREDRLNDMLIERSSHNIQLSPANYWEERARRFAARGFGLKAVCSYAMPWFYNLAIDLTQRRALLPWLKRTSGKAVLDVGCGVGRWSRLMAAEGAKVTGLDISPTMLAEAARRAALAGATEKCNFVLGDLAALKSDFTYDYIFVITVLQHILDKDHLDSAIKALKSHLAPDGRIVLLEAAPTKPLEKCNTKVFEARTKSYYLSVFAEHHLATTDIKGVDLSYFRTLLLPYYQRLPEPIRLVGLALLTCLSLPIDLLIGKHVTDSSWHKVFVLEHAA